MPKIGTESYITRLISKKTKIKPIDILDVLKALPECLCEAFFDVAPAEKEVVSFGFVSMHWKMTGFGPSIVFKPSDSFKRHAVMLKLEKKTKFSEQMYEKMMQKSKERAAERIAKEGNLNNIKSPKKPIRTAESVAKYNKSRRILREKRKKQAILLKKAID